MISYTQYINRFTDLTQNSATTNQTRGAQFVNDALRFLSTKYYFNEVSQDIPLGTQGGVTSYPLPFNIKELVDFYITVGSLRYVPTEVPSASYYDRLQFAQYSSDIPQYYWVFNNTINVFPTPATTTNKMTFRYKRRLRDLSQADYTTGTVSVSQYKTGSFTAVANSATLTGAVGSGTPILANTDAVTLQASTSVPTGFTAGTTYYVVNQSGTTSTSYTFQLSATLNGAAITPTSAGSGTLQYQVASNVVTGSGTSWTNDFIGRWIQFTANSSSNTTTGDNNWYQIQAVGSSTSLTLVNDYQGLSISGGSYTIGEMPLLPEDYQVLALYYALWIYYTSIKPDLNQAGAYKQLYDIGCTKLDAEYGNKSTNVAILSNDTELTNPNLYLRNAG